MGDIADQSTLTEDWTRIQAAFPARSAIRLKWTLYNGLSTRMSNKRLTRMMTGDGPDKLRDIMNASSDQRIKALRVMADVNHEQTSAAFKATMVSNVSAPLAFLALLHQILPGGLSQIVSYIQGEGPFLIYWNIGLMIIVSVMLMFVVGYAIANLGQSRDIKNLIDIYAAERGIFFGLEDNETA